MNEEEQVKKIAELQQQFGQLESTVKQHLSKEAIIRYGNLKTAHSDKAMQVVAILAQLIQSGQVNEKISDEMFKGILMKLQPARKEFKITKK